MENESKIKNILIIRFRQMGDAVLSMVVCNTLHENFPHAKIDMVLNERIAPLFEHHPAINQLITFSEVERHHIFRYLRKVYKVVHEKHYDVIIDMRTTINTLPFALFSLSTHYRIGIRKNYTWFAHNYRIKRDDPSYDILQKNLVLLHPLEGIKKLNYTRDFVLSVSDEEKQQYKEYLIKQGIDFSRPILLAGVTTKLPYKNWNENKMIEVLQRLIENYPDMQIIFNYAPGEEERSARRIYEKLGKPKNIYIDIEAQNLRELAAINSLISFYFGNEGGNASYCPSHGNTIFCCMFS